MTLDLTENEQIARIKTTLRLGAGFVLQADSHADSCGDSRADSCRWLVLAGEALSAKRLCELRKLGAVSLIITQRRAETLALWSPHAGLAQIAIPNDADTYWVQAMADPACDLNVPLKGPFETNNTAPPEVALTLLDLCKASYLLPAVVIVALTAKTKPPLDTIDHATLQKHLAHAPTVALVSSARVPLAINKDTRLHTFRPDDGGAEHYAIELGEPLRDTPVLVRLHSACFTGDLLGSLRCDCGAQLNGAMALMVKRGGVLLYMNQEGRGIGLANKMRAYRLQDQGFDTVQANHRLGFEDDERDFALGAAMLRTLGFKQIRLLTNNPKKTAMMSAAGMTVAEQVPLRVGKTAENADYLRTKADKSGHLL